MKKIVALTALIIMLVNGAGFYLYYPLQLKLIRMEMRERLRNTPDDNLVQITLSHADFKKAHIDKHEIRYHGRMFDLARIVTTKDSVTVFGEYDVKEDNLLNYLDHLFKSPVKKSTLPASVLQYLHLTYILPNENWQPRLIARTIEFFTAYCALSIRFSPSVTAPPPQW